MASSRHVLGARAVLERQRTLGDHLTSVGADNVDAENTVRLLVCEELDHAVRVQVGLGPRVGGEGESADLVLDTLFLELLLVLPDPGHFGMRVHDRGDGGVVDVAVILGDELDGGDGFLLSLVRQHGTESAVANDANVGMLRAVLLVDHNAAALVDLQTNVLETETSRVGATANSNEDDFGIELGGVSFLFFDSFKATDAFLLATLGSLDADLDCFSAVITVEDLGVELELDALLAQSLLDVL